MYKNICFAFFMLCLTNLQGQELGMHFMKNIWQSNLTNPALLPKSKITFALPAVNVNFTHSSLSYNDLVSTNSEGLTVINSQDLIANLNEQNYLRMRLGLETFHFSFGIKKMRFSLHHALKAQGFFRYPKALAQLGFEGNASFIGQEIGIGPGFDLMAYNEIGLGFGMKISKLSIGGRIKTLTGLANASSDITTARLTTNEEYYQLQLASNYIINTAGGFTIDTEGEGFSPDFNLENFEFGDFLRMNRGWAIDLGGQLELNDKLTVAASIVDLGFIRWSENASNFTSQGSYTFEGFDADQLWQDDEINFDSSLDTIFDTFNFQESSNDYTTSLASKIYLSGQYKITSMFRAGALVYLENFKGTTLPAFALNGSVDVGKILSAGLVYSIHNRSYTNIGLNLTAKFGPTQFFVLSDNVLAATRPASSRGTNLRFGLNLAFK